MSKIARISVITALLSIAAFAQTTIVEYSKKEADKSRSYLMNCSTVGCNTVWVDVAHLEKFGTLEEAMQFMADHQDYKLIHFYSALVAVDVRVEEKKTSEPQPPIQKTEKVYKYGSLTTKKRDVVMLGNGTISWSADTVVIHDVAPN